FSASARSRCRMMKLPAERAAATAMLTSGCTIGRSGRSGPLEYHAMSSVPPSAKLLANVRVVLVSPRHPGNIGAAARAMKNMGLPELVLVTPEGALEEKERALAAHAVDILESARIVDTLPLATAGCSWVVATSARPRHLGDEPMTPWDAASRIVDRA